MKTRICFTVFFVLLLCHCHILAQSISISTTGAAYNEDFNSLSISGASSTMPNGWYILETGANANTLYNTGTGTSNTGDTYSFGDDASSDRTLGSLYSSNLIPLVGAKFTNNTPHTINKLMVTYTGKTWRIGAANRVDRYDFQLSTNASALNVGAWDDYDLLDYITPGDPTTGGGYLRHSELISSPITGFSVSPGSTFWIRFDDYNSAGADDGMGIDNWSITAYMSPQCSAGPDATACQNFPFTITSATASFYTAVSWTTNGTGTLTGANSLNPIYTPASGETGVITLTLKATGSPSNEITTDQMQLSILEGPTAHAGIDATIEQGSSITINTASASNYTSVNWTTNIAGTFSNAGTLSPTFMPESSFSGTASLVLHVTGLSPCGVITDTMLLTVEEPIPVPQAFAGNNASLCESTVNYLLSDATASGYTGLMWTTAGTGSFSNANILNPIYTPSVADFEAGSVLLTLTAYGTPQATDQMTLTLIKSALAYAGPDRTAQQGGSILINDATASNFYSLVWTANVEGFFMNQGTIAPTFTPPANFSGEAILTLTANGISPCGNISDQMVVLFEAFSATAATWTGSNSTDWNNPHNWNGGVVPNDSTDVIIPSSLTRYPQLGTLSYCRNIVLEDGASLLGNSLLSVSKDATIYKVFTPGRKYFISSPVLNPTFSSVFPLAISVKSFKETDNTWVALSGSQPLQAGKGYSVEGFQDFQAFYKGNLNSQDFNIVNLQNTATTAHADGGWHLIGNPYPSALDWDKGDWDRNGIDGTIYTWNGTQYICWTGTAGALAAGIIPLGQAFFIHVSEKQKTGNLIIPENGRVANNTPIYKSTEANTLSFLVKEIAQQLADETFLQFKPNTTIGFDKTGDAYKLPGLPDAPQLFTLSDGIKLAVNALPSYETISKIDIGLHVGFESSYSIEVSGIETFATSVDIYLKDQKHGSWYNLRNTPVISFTASPSDNEKRFLVSFTKPERIAEAENAGFDIFNVPQGILVRNNKAIFGEMMVFNVNGQQILNAAIPEYETTLAIKQAGVYFLRFNTSIGVLMKKIVVL